jgi:hypothetical protein
MDKENESQNGSKRVDQTGGRMFNLGQRRKP